MQCRQTSHCDSALIWCNRPNSRNAQVEWRGKKNMLFAGPCLSHSSLLAVHRFSPSICPSSAQIKGNRVSFNSPWPLPLCMCRGFFSRMDSSGPRNEEIELLISDGLVTNVVVDSLHWRLPLMSCVLHLSICVHGRKLSVLSFSLTIGVVIIHWRRSHYIHRLFISEAKQSKPHTENTSKAP